MDKEIETNIMLDIFQYKSCTKEELVEDTKYSREAVEENINHLISAGYVTKTVREFLPYYILTPIGVYELYHRRQSKIFDSLHELFESIGYDVEDYSQFIMDRLYLIYTEGEYVRELGGTIDAYHNFTGAGLLCEFKSWLKNREFTLKQVLSYDLGEF